MKTIKPSAVWLFLLLVGQLLLVGCLGAAPARAQDGTTPPAPVLPGDETPAQAIFGTQLLVSAYTGPLFDLTRASDLTVLTIMPTSTGAPDIDAINAFLGGSNGYYTRVYDQSGNGFDATQPVLASAPILAPGVSANGAPAMLFGSETNKYQASVDKLGPAGRSGNTITLSMPTPSWVIPGFSLSGANIISGGKLTVLSVNGQTLNCAAFKHGEFAPGLSIGWAGGPGNAVIANISGAAITVAGAVPAPTITSAVAANVVTALATNGFSIEVAPQKTPKALKLAAPAVWLDLPTALQVPWQNHSMAVAVRPGALYSGQFWLTLGEPESQPQGKPGALPYSSIAGVDGGLTSGNVFLSSARNAVATLANFPETVDFDVYQVNRSGDTVSWNLGRLGSGAGDNTGTSPIILSGGSLGMSQQFNGSAAGFGFEGYGFAIYATALPPDVTQNIQTDFYALLGVAPPPAQQVVFSGSSTVQGTGQNYAEGVATSAQRTLLSQSPSIVYNFARGATNEDMLSTYNNDIGAVYNPNLAPGANILVFHPALADGLSEGETADQVWATSVAMMQTARAQGYVILLLGGEPKVMFLNKPAMLQAFHDIKATMAQQWSSYADAYVDLQSQPPFAGDSPWVQYPDYWQADRQHFTPLGYQLETSMALQGLFDAGLLVAPAPPDPSTDVRSRAKRR